MLLLLERSLFSVMVVINRLIRTRLHLWPREALWVTAHKMAVPVLVMPEVSVTPLAQVEMVVLMHLA